MEVVLFWRELQRMRERLPHVLAGIDLSEVGKFVSVSFRQDVRHLHRHQLLERVEGFIRGNFHRENVIAARRIPVWTSAKEALKAVTAIPRNRFKLSYTVSRTDLDPTHKIWTYTCKTTMNMVYSYSTSQEVAEELGIRKTLQFLGTDYPTLEIPRYRSDPAILIEPNINQQLRAEAARRGRRLIYFMHTLPPSSDPLSTRKHHDIVYTYTIGNESFKGLHYDGNFAERYAAKTPSPT